MRRAVCSLAIFCLSMCGIDHMAAALCRSSRLPDRVTDIQHPTTLVAKLDRLRTADGPKVVLLGDSLVYGGVLADHGDSDWREHELGSCLAAELEARSGDRPFVMNLGMNGALPADLEVLVPLVAACDVDWIIFDIHLRPFSADFSLPQTQMSRPWLLDLAADPDGRVRWRPGHGIGGRLAGHLAGNSALFLNRGLIQDNLLASRAANNPVLRPASRISETDGEVQTLVRMAQLKKRLQSLDLGPDGPQAAAMERLLAGLAARGQRHVVFYAKENPDLLPDVLDPAQHAAQYEVVASIIRKAQGPTGVFVPPASELRAEHFLDFTHVNAEGYRLLARGLAAALE